MTAHETSNSYRIHAIVEVTPPVFTAENFRQSPYQLVSVSVGLFSVMKREAK
jgi:hypothetical protein